jgi:NIMA (never in mitosis gene a)-related kinase
MRRAPSGVSLTPAPYYARPETAHIDPNLEIGGDLSDFLVQEELGKGAHGVVYKVKSLKNNNTYVMKKIDLLQFKNKAKSEIQKEAQILKKLRNPNIIRCYNSFISSNTLHIILEYAEGGDLHQLIKKFKGKSTTIPESLIWKICYDLVNGLKYLHSQKVIHRDIKTNNILIMADKSFKIGDLGVSVVLSGSSKNH